MLITQFLGTTKFGVHKTIGGIGPAFSPWLRTYL